MRKLFTILFLSFIFIVKNHAQVSIGGKPFSFNGKYISAKVKTVLMPEVNADSLIAADAINNTKGSGPWIFGYNHYTNINPSNSGQWETLLNGDKIWRVAIECPKALSINLTFDKYVLPKGATLYIYNDTKDYVLGAFTDANNQEDKQLGVDIVPGSKTIVEYYEPAWVSSTAELSIYRVTHGYKDLFGWAKAFGDAGSCNYNVNCTPIGTGWTKQRDAVAIIVVGGSGACTGAMVDDVPHSNTPYFLTANHCGTTGVGTWVFRWNWQAAGCPNPTTSPSTAQTTSGSVLRANNASTDFTLLQLNSTPPASYNVFYAGWDRSGTTPTRGMGIHHPSGDIKKISSSASPFISTAWAGTPANSHWQVNWQADSGITEPGSSGSPIFDQNQRIVGQLHGGPSSCSASLVNRNDDYGKFSMSWTGNGSSSSAARLMDWLDPASTGTNTTDGHYFGTTPIVDSLDLQVDSISEPIGAYCNDSSYTPRVKVSNQGANTVYSFSLKSRMDAGTWATTNWTGTLLAGASVYVNIPTVTTTSGNHTYTVASSSPNSRADQDNSNDTLRNTFRARRGGPVTFKIMTDDYPLETSLAIYNPTTNDTFLRINAGDLTGTRTTYTYSLCMSDVCYRLKIYDGGNDGICCSFGNGYYTVYNGPDTLLNSVPFTNNLTQNFCNYQLPDISITASDISICAGDNVLLTAIEDDNTSRQWVINGPGLSLLDTSFSINPTLNNPGTYSVILRGFNPYGQDSSILSITVNDLPTATYTVVNATTPSNGSITATITSGATPVSHRWNNGMSGNPLNGLAPGTYYDTIIDANGCINIYSAIVQNSVGIDDIKNINGLNVYPNPFTNEIRVTLFNISKIKEIILLNSLGENIDIKTQIVDNNTIKISIPAVSTGVYYLIAKDNGITYKSKLIKQ
jgi:hypothetical protein